MKTKRFLSIIIALTMVFSLMTAMSVSASAAYSNACFNVSNAPAKGNLSNYNLPADVVPQQGETAYINLAATTDFYFDRAEFLVKAPGSNSFSRVYNYDPSGYFRWCYYPYTFNSSGTYTVRVVVTATNGAQATGEISFDVTAKTAANNTNGNTYTYGGTTYDVVPNFKSEYCFNQKDYSRFENKNGSNRGCTATAMCIAYSIYHDKALSPNDVKWSWLGTSWEYCTRYSDTNKTYWGGYFTQSEALKAAYNCIVNSGKPMIVGVNGSGSDHVVTVVGVKQNANINNLSLGDFLIVDPWGGTICSLNSYKSLDCGWALRIPIN